MGYDIHQEFERDPLTRQALQLYIEKVQRENAESRTWIRQPNNFISALAIVLSLMSIGWEIHRDISEDIGNDLAALSGIASDLTQMDVQTLTTAPGQDGVQTAINNRRVVLLAEADRIIEKRYKYVPLAQLAVLAPEYGLINQQSTALKYSLLLTKDPATPFEKLESWRSIGILYASEGPKSFNDARSAFASALTEVSTLPDPNGVGSIQLALSVRQQWGDFESNAENYSEAASQLNEAQKLVNKLPCMAWRVPIASQIKSDGQAALENLLRANPTQGISAKQTWSRTLAEDKCPIVRNPTQSLSSPGRSNSGLSSICRFTNGRRAGTTFDFAQLGYPPHPIGSACTDGKGSIGKVIQQSH